MKEPKLESIAHNPTVRGLLPHLKVPVDFDAPPLFFLPGDPGRLELFREEADSFEMLSSNREFWVGVGVFHGKRFGVCSTGIGGGSTEIAVVELGELGVQRLVRVGGCGAIQPFIDCGDVVLNSGAVRLGGSSKHYVRPEYPAVADPFLLTALFHSAKSMGIRCHVGIGATVDSYYAGQGRPVPGLPGPADNTVFNTMQAAGVLNMDMETETIFTLASLLGMKAANILGVHGNRQTNLWLSDFSATQVQTVRIALQTLLEEPKMKEGSF
ncbi:MAG TPA: nucleoside phosphorylase [Thermotogota bacterium]|mgnify:CR=1 FL=1|nr:nucleoside phosphorylase [Thermotogota bacterium]